MNSGLLFPLSKWRNETMKAGDLLFVYGTLRQGERADLSKNPQMKYVGPDKINGKLYDVGWFPGAKLIDGIMGFEPAMPTITGDLFEIVDEAVVVRLDSYESFPSLFDRNQVETGSSKYAWVYTFNPRISEDSLVLNGDWSHNPRPDTTIEIAPPVTTIAATLGGGAGAV